MKTNFSGLKFRRECAAFNILALQPAKTSAMSIEKENWTYNEFLAFLLLYGAQLDADLPEDEIEFIRQRTGINAIDKIKAKVDSLTDVEAIEVIDSYRNQYLDTAGKKEKVKADLEALLKTEGNHSQLEKAAVHMVEKLI
jgi:hypothetical protein